jgi:predicted nucleotide-binding protein (sugar kinase/HSP70/actin superfamily)
MKVVVMPDGFEIQVEPVMTEIEHLTSGTRKYYSYENYLRFCKVAIETFKEKDLLEQVTGLKPKPMTRQEWADFLGHSKERIRIQKKKRKVKKSE